MSVCIYMHAYHVPKRTSDPLKLEIVRCHGGARTKAESSARVASILNQCSCRERIQV